MLVEKGRGLRPVNPDCDSVDRIGAEIPPGVFRGVLAGRGGLLNRILIFGVSGKDNSNCISRCSCWCQSSGEKPVAFPNPNLTYLVRPVPFLAIHEIRLALTFFPTLT